MDKQTQPPKHFTDATLLAAMTGIARYVKDAELKKILKETDGIGTEATRAGIIELLFNRQYLARKGKLIVSTEIGQNLINSLPEMATTPDMTAQWESQLTAITERKESYQSFMSGLLGIVNQMTFNIEPTAFGVLKGKGQKRSFSKKGYSKKKYSTTKKRVAKAKK